MTAIATLMHSIARQKLNKIMKISLEDWIMIKNLYLSKRYGARRLLHEFHD